MKNLNFCSVEECLTFLADKNYFCPGDSIKFVGNDEEDTIERVLVFNSCGEAGGPIAEYAIREFSYITINDVRDAFEWLRDTYVGRDFNEVLMEYYADVNTIEEASKIDSINEVIHGDFTFELHRGDDGRAEENGCQCFTWVKGYCEPDLDDDYTECFGFDIEPMLDGSYSFEK